MQSQSIQQLNIAYDSEQDRLLLRAGMADGKEIPLWITYRIARQMFKVLNAEAMLPVAPSAESLLDTTQSVAEATRQFAQEAQAVQSLDDLDFETGYTVRESAVGTREMLVTETRFVAINDQLNTMQLGCANGMQATFNLNKSIVLAIARMLQIAARDAHWALQPVAGNAVSTGVTQPASNKQVLH